MTRTNHLDWVNGELVVSIDGVKEPYQEEAYAYGFSLAGVRALKEKGKGLPQGVRIEFIMRTAEDAHTWLEEVTAKWEKDGETRMWLLNLRKQLASARVLDAKGLPAIEGHPAPYYTTSFHSLTIDEGVRALNWVFARPFKNYLGNW